MAMLHEPGVIAAPVGVIALDSKIHVVSVLEIGLTGALSEK